MCLLLPCEFNEQVFYHGYFAENFDFFFQNSYFWMAASNFLRKERIPTYSLFEEGFAFFLAEFQLFNNVRGVQSVLFYETHKIHFHRQ